MPLDEPARISVAAKILSASSTVSKQNWPISWISEAGILIQVTAGVPTSMQHYLGGSEGVPNKTPFFKSAIALVN